MIPERVSGVRKSIPEAKKIKKIKTGCKPDERCHWQTSLFTARG